MTFEELYGRTRDELRCEIDAAARARLERQRANRRLELRHDRQFCRGCGIYGDLFTPGCLSCRRRKNARAQRDRQRQAA